MELARKGFFDGTIFHRIVPGFVIQGGDPTGKGTGGPGYKTVEPPPAGTLYTHGIVAMAKAANEPPGTAGSQFFIVTGKNVGLPPSTRCSVRSTGASTSSTGSASSATRTQSSRPSASR